MRFSPRWFLAAVPVGATLSAAGCNQISGVTDYEKVDQVTPALCAANADCAGSSGGEPAVCRKADGVCVRLTSEDCTVESSDYLNDEAFIFASILPLTNPAGQPGAGAPLRNAMRLAVEDFRVQANGLLPRPGGPSPRPLVMLECNDTGNIDVARRAARHVVQAGLPAVVGPMFSGITYAVADEITADAGVFLISPTASTQSLTTLNDDGLVWRTAPTADLQVEALAKFMTIVEQDPAVRSSLKLGPTDPVYVATVSKGDSFGDSLAAGLRDQLLFNGFRATDPANNVYFSEQKYGNPDNPSVSKPEYERAVAGLINDRPHFVFLLGVEEINTEILPALEAGWGDGAPRPFYLSASGPYTQSLFGFVGGPGAATGIRRRVLGVVPGTNNRVFANFRSSYGGSFEDNEADTSGPSHAYDAVYLLAFAVVALGNEPITGANLAAMMARMVPPADVVVDAGPAQLASALNLLAGGGSINFNGASGPVDFDLKTGDSQISEMQIWCVGTSNKGQYSGAYYGIDNRLLYNDRPLATLDDIRTNCGF